MSFSPEWKRAFAIFRELYGYEKYDIIPRSDFMKIVSDSKEWLSIEASNNYHNHIKSPEWRIKRKNVLERDGYTCQSCSLAANEVHHLSYDTMGTCNEESDCVSLCHECHMKQHNKRLS